MKRLYNFFVSAPDSIRAYYGNAFLSVTRLKHARNGVTWRLFLDMEALPVVDKLRLSTDQYRDDETELYYYNARYYNPKIGRFVTPDWIVQAPGNSQSLNRYSYVWNNPIRFTDPTGNIVPFSFSAVGNAVGKTVSWAYQTAQSLYQTFNFGQVSNIQNFGTNQSVTGGNQITQSGQQTTASSESNFYNTAGTAATVAGAGTYGTGLFAEAGGVLARRSGEGEIFPALGKYISTSKNSYVFLSSEYIKTASFLGGAVAAGTSVYFDLSNPEMSTARKSISLISNGMTVYGEPLTKLIGVGGTLVNTFAGQQIESGIKDVVDGVKDLGDYTTRTINYYNNNPTNLLRDLNR